MGREVSATRGIAFSAPMSVAQRDGRKTQTRRVIKRQPPDGVPLEVGLYHPTVVRRGMEEPGPEVFGACDVDGAWGEPCPYGAPGDLLYVKEQLRRSDTTRVLYADGTSARDRDGHDYVWPWKPSSIAPRYCPRWASRTTLRVTSVRVERVQDISDADIAAEGMDAAAVAALWAKATRKQRREAGMAPDAPHYMLGGTAVIKDPVRPIHMHYSPGRTDLSIMQPRDLWRIGWTLINGLGSWNSNVWIWVVGFEVLP